MYAKVLDKCRICGVNAMRLSFGWSSDGRWIGDINACGCGVRGDGRAVAHLERQLQLDAGVDTSASCRPDTST